jgi:predicted ester cyclase
MKRGRFRADQDAPGMPPGSIHDAHVIQLIGEGDLVATSKTFTGTHMGELPGVPPRASARPSG